MKKSFLLLAFLSVSLLTFNFSQVIAQESWTPTTTINAPSARFNHISIWTGTNMIIWGGYDSTSFFNTGGKYDPISDSWLSTSVINAPTPRVSEGIWTGQVLGGKMIIWGGDNGYPNCLNTGGIYDPNSNTWQSISTVNAPSVRTGHSAIWTGSKMIVWGGYYVASNGFYNSLKTGGIYDPVTGNWQGTSTINAPLARHDHVAIWTGSKMIVWGGVYEDSLPGWNYLKSGGIYDPVTDSWQQTSETNAPSSRVLASAIWTGDRMAVWGGYVPPGTLNTGGLYDPNTDSWTGSSILNAPASRENHTVIWTGLKMIIWGGENEYPNYYNTGGIFDPIQNNWASVTTINAPSPRVNHSCVWTGNSMIIWGGRNSSSLNTGGIYSNPSVIGIENYSSIVPTKFDLFQNYPNPFNPTTKIKFAIPSAVGVAYMRPVQINIYDILGRKVATLVNENLKPGEYETEWNASNFASGVYFYQLTVNSEQATIYSQTKKLVLIK